MRSGRIKYYTGVRTPTRMLHRADSRLSRVSQLYNRMKSCCTMDCQTLWILTDLPCSPRRGLGPPLRKCASRTVAKAHNKKHIFVDKYIENIGAHIFSDTDEMRRGLGVAGIRARDADTTAAAALGAAAAKEDASRVEAQLATFRDRLAVFAAKHRTAINRDPVFRGAFARMARSCGVDPLASSAGAWSRALGLGDFYYALAVQVVDACLASRAADGGLTALSELLTRLRRMRGPAAGALDIEDIRRAVEALAGLGGGYRLLALVPGGELYLLSVPVEMNADRTALLTRLALSSGAAPPTTSTAAVSNTPLASCARATFDELRAALGWTAPRTRAAVDALLTDGLAWLDTQAQPPLIFFPGIAGLPPR